MNAGRVGQELYPYLIVLVVVILAFEQVLSNRFYQDYDTSVARSRTAQMAARSHVAPRESKDVPLSAS